jgi:hypothetical protein
MRDLVPLPRTRTVDASLPLPYSARMSLRRASLLLALPVLGALVGCKDDAPPSGPSPAKSAAPFSTAKPSTSASGVAAAPSASGATIGDEQKAKLKAYGAAMEKGRKATREKDWPTAIASFGLALSHRPGDVRALSERGYAKDLAGDFDGALKDLRKALGAARSADLQAQIWFNIGLAEEGRKDDEAARIAFAKSNELRPTKQAQAKLAGKAPACTAASVDRSYAPGSEYAGWLPAYQGLVGRYRARNPGLPIADATTDEEAKALLCKAQGCVGEGPWIVSVGDAAVLTELHVIVPAPGDAKKLLAFEEVGEGIGGSCAYVDQVVIKGGDPLQVHVSSADRDVVYVRKGATGEMQECTKDFDGCEVACMPGEWQERDLFFDVAKKRRVVAIDQTGTGAKKLVDVSRAKGEVVLAGQGCDQRVSTVTPM